MWIGTQELLDSEDEYLSSWTNVKNATRIRGVVYADQDGTLRIEGSSDGVNYDTEVNETAVTAATQPGEGVTFSQELKTPFIRVRFTNGNGGNQTEFRLWSRLYEH
jgi:hypothetical protein